MPDLVTTLFGQLPYFDIQCVSKNSYGYTKRDATTRIPSLKGRPRYRLRDRWATYTLTVQFEFTSEQYHQFQIFWYDEIKSGLDPFAIRLMLDSDDFYNNNSEMYAAMATSAFDSSYTGVNLWTVSIPIQISGGFRTNIVECPTIYGGPITNLAADNIYGGPITNLATDIILPCPGIDPNG